MELVIFIIVGIFTGLSAGLLGIGGGIVSVPAMIFLLPYFDVPVSLIMHVAIATSLALIIPTSLMSAYGHFKHNAIAWHYVRKFVPGLVLGSAVGAGIVTFLNRETLQPLFAVLLMLIALYMLFPKSSENSSRPVLINDFLPASVIGVISALMGVGGGTMTVPYLMWRGLVLPKAIGSSAFCGLPIAVVGSVTLLILNAGNNPAEAEAGSLIYFPAFWGILIGAMIFAPVGAGLVPRINAVLLKRIFILMLLVVAIRLLVH